jgi:hypothetical protein
MRFLTTLCSLALTAGAISAQSPLTTTFANDGIGAVGGAVYFELECFDPFGAFITDLDLNFAGPGGAAGSISLYVKAGGLAPHTSPDWVGPLSVGNVASTMPVGTPTNVGLAPSFQLGFGCKLGIAIVANGIAHAYTDATSLPTTYSTSQLQLTVGGASNVPFAGGLIAPQLANISIPYAQGGVCPSIATVQTVGTGCGGGPSFASFYELFGITGFDLDGMKLTGTNNGSGYTLTLAAGTGFTVPIGATLVALTDDSSAAVGTLGLLVGSNCWLANGPGNSLGFTPTVATALNNPATTVYAWNDLNPGAVGSGQVFYDEVGTVGRATYDGVYSFGTTAPNSIQITYDTSNGNFSIEWDGVATTIGGGTLVGYSPGGPSANPGASDISTAAPFTIATSDGITEDLSLTSIGRPIQSNVPVAYQVTTGNIPPTALGHVGIFGLVNPAAPLAVVGMPDCFAWASLDVLLFHVLPQPTPSNFTWTAVTLPASGPFRRVYNFHLNAVVFGTDVNSAFGLGALTSNGLKCRSGKL